MNQLKANQDMPNISASEWMTHRIDMVVVTDQGPSTMNVLGQEREGLSFAVVQIWYDEAAWALVHKETGRLAPALFPDEDGVKNAATALEGFGDWNAALRNWVETGVKVPFKDEAKEIVLKCGGAHYAPAPDPGSPRTVC